MADAVRMAGVELVREAEAEPGLDGLREGVRVLAEAVMDLDVEQPLGAGRHERSPERSGHRNGHRERVWGTRVGTIALRVPRGRDGSAFPARLEPRPRAERVVLAVVQDVYGGGVWTRRVDGLVKRLGMEGISKSPVRRSWAELDADVERFRSRPLSEPYPYLWLDAAFVQVREAGRVVSQAVVSAVGVTADGPRAILGGTSAPATMARSGGGLCARWWPAGGTGSAW
jgi:transposase-like protein